MTSRVAQIMGLACLAGLAACAAERTPPPRPAEQPRPQPQRLEPQRPEPAPPRTDWRDLPLSQGDWSYRGGPSGSEARFGPAGAPSFVFRCDLSRRQIVLGRTGASAGPVTIRTTSTARTVQAQAEGGGAVVRVAASEPLLDAMVFSRGRIAIEAPGTAMLILPSWAEPARVLEDCRL